LSGSCTIVALVADAIIQSPRSRKAAASRAQCAPNSTITGSVEAVMVVAVAAIRCDTWIMVRPALVITLALSMSSGRGNGMRAGPGEATCPP